MPDVLVIMATLAALSVAGWLTFWTVVVWMLRRHNRVAPDVRSPAPLRWLVSPGWAAQLHRRLRCSVQLVRAAGARDGASSLSELAENLIQQAVLVDADLVAAARLPLRGRWVALTSLAQRTATVSATAARLSDLAGRRAAPPSGASSLAQLSQRVDLLVQAHADLDGLDRAAGLARP